MERSFRFFVLFVMVMFNFVYNAKAACDDGSHAALSSLMGVIAYSNGACTGDPSGCGDCQCVEYVKRFHGISGSTGDGGQVFGNRADGTFNQYADGFSDTPPQAGDIICFDDGGYGHVGIIASVSETTVEMIDQNRSSSSARITLSLTESGGYYSVGSFSSSYWVQGWLRHPDWEPPEICYETRPMTADDPVHESLVLTDPDGSYFDFHAYYEDGGALALLDRGDMGSDLANPVIDDEGSVGDKYRWLVGDVDGSGYDDIVLVTHPTSSTFKAHVWTSNGDGSFDTRVRWLEESGQADEYYLSDKDGDGTADLITATQNGSGVVLWEKCNSAGSSFNSCSTWMSDFGSDVDDDVFLVGDLTGDGRADILRGYVVSGAGTCSIGDAKLKWRVRPSGSSSASTWKGGWGCASSQYFLGNVNGDGYGRMDLIQARPDDPTTSPIFVAISNGSSFSSASRWKRDFGSPGHTYFLHDVDQDGDDDLISYVDDSSDNVRVVYSNGSEGVLGSEFGIGSVLISGVDKETGGAFRFGDFGDIYLYIGEEEVIVDCFDAGSGSVSTGSGSSSECGEYEIADNGIDDNCDGVVDDDDCDGDGYWWSDNDCDDSDPSVNPGATEIAGNGIDDDCDGTIDESLVDLDSDGYDSIADGGTDCDDSDASVYPGATEDTSNGIDDDCDGYVDEDGVCSSGVDVSVSLISPMGWVINGWHNGDTWGSGISDDLCVSDTLTGGVVIDFNAQHTDGSWLSLSVGQTATEAGFDQVLINGVDYIDDCQVTTDSYGTNLECFSYDYGWTGGSGSSSSCTGSETIVAAMDPPVDWVIQAWHNGDAYSSDAGDYLCVSDSLTSGVVLDFNAYSPTYGWLSMVEGQIAREVGFGSLEVSGTDRLDSATVTTDHSGTNVECHP